MTWLLVILLTWADGGTVRVEVRTYPSQRQCEAVGASLVSGMAVKFGDEVTPMVWCEARKIG